MWAFDEQLGQIIASTTQPMVGQIRLTWWREALNSAVSGHPLLEELTSVTSTGIDSEALGVVIDGWEEVLEPLPLTTDQLARFATARGTQLFTLSARLIEVTIPESVADSVGAGWALADFACRCSDRVTADRALAMANTYLAVGSLRSLPRPLRILARLARHDVAAGKRTARTPWQLLRSVA